MKGGGKGSLIRAERQSSKELTEKDERGWSDAKTGRKGNRREVNGGSAKT